MISYRNVLNNFLNNFFKNLNILFLCVQKLLKCRERLCEELKLDKKNVEISMGMSADFEHAVSSQTRLIAQVTQFVSVGFS